MNENPNSSSPWWQGARARNVAHKPALVAPSALAKPGDAFLIITEGKVTEPAYFDQLRTNLHLGIVDIRIQPGEAPDPRLVVKTAAREAKEHHRLFKKGKLPNTAPARFDHVWAVVDTDVAVREGFWNEVVQLAQAHKVTLAPSTPCIEFWLLLHLCYNTRTDLWDGDRAKRALAAEVKMKLNLDYSTEAKKAKAAIAKLLNHWPEAVRNAGRVRQYHASAGTTEPANPSTEVDRLVRAMNDAALPHNRRHIP